MKGEFVFRQIIEQFGAEHERIVGVVNEVIAERGRQNTMWGVQDHLLAGPTHDPGTAADLAEYYREKLDKGEVNWLNILMEEVWEAFAETHPSLIRGELIQVAAVVVQIIEYLDRQEEARAE